MSQPVGLNFKSKIPELQDNASIEEALRVYHYGIDNYSTQEIPNDSIEGNFRTLTNRVVANENAISALGTTFVEQVSNSVTPNTITPQTPTTVPLTLKGEELQTGNLQQWQNNAGTNLAVVFSDGSSSFNGSVSIGSNNKTSNVSLNVKINNNSNKGIVVRRAPSQSSNMQEWQDENENTISWIDKDARFYYRGDELSGNLNSFFLMGS